CLLEPIDFTPTSYTKAVSLKPWSPRSFCPRHSTENRCPAMTRPAPRRRFQPLIRRASSRRFPTVDALFLCAMQDLCRRARRTSSSRFAIEARPDEPAQDLELYMGMLGHAAFVKRDGSVFSHLHPTGSVPMAMLDLVQREGAKTDPHAAHHHSDHAVLPSEVS